MSQYVFSESENGIDDKKGMCHICIHHFSRIWDYYLIK